jgi:hypothetical protein
MKFDIGNYEKKYLKTLEKIAGTQKTLDQLIEQNEQDHTNFYADIHKLLEKKKAVESIEKQEEEAMDI